MPEEFDIQKLQKEYPEFFEQISPELLEFIFSEETSSTIAEICSESGVINEEKIEKIVYRVVLALCGQIPQRNLAEILERGAGLDAETAKKIHLELNRLIFSKFREARPPRPSPLAEEEGLETSEETSSPAPGEEIKKPSRKDVYREPVE